MERILRRVGLIVFFGILAGCASRSVELTSDPAGLEIQTLGGETLGTTPVILKDEALEKASSTDGLLAVRFVAPGYLPQTLLVEVRGTDSYRMHPIKLDETFFRKYILRDFAQEHNFMIREMLNIQGLIRTKKYGEAEEHLVAFQEKFPTVAITYVMLANLSLVRGDKLLARRYLIQAQNLDPDDGVILRMLRAAGGVVNSENPEEQLQSASGGESEEPVANLPEPGAAPSPGLAPVEETSQRQPATVPTEGTQP